ncbi:MAG TPA: hypothetical protein VJZ00_01370 [Thermoanaerobaculia bacterium]|nr:hypothetical protein [Thermoanaerobaculia bacterium]
MRRTLFLIATALFTLQAFAAPARPTAWVKRAPFVADAVLADASGPRPIVLLETNYYTFLPNEQLQLRLTVDPNGTTAPVTMYLYREDRTTGERRYYNVNGGLQSAGSAVDLFGQADAPVPVFAPVLNDFVLFGSASDTSQLSFGVNGALGSGITAGPVGLFQWVIELRDAAGKRVLARSNAMYSNITSSINVSGTITSSQTWTANNRYVLNDFVGVAAPAVLTIEPGTVVYGGGTRATLFIQRGAKIIADGTARRPIIMTSAQRTGNRAQRDWGSLVLLGAAPINVPGGQAFLEGLPSEPAYAFGGTNANDSSGIVRYVRLEFGGFEIATNQEINGLTCGGCGAGTVIDYVEVLHNKDDAFEFFGGTANAKHLLGIAFADDGLDFDNGYIGNIQFAALIKRAVNDESDSNIFTESDNNATGGADTPLTHPHVYNVTAVRVASGVGNYGGVLRRNTAGEWMNSIVTGSRLAPITLRDTGTFNNAAAGSLIVNNSILDGSFADTQFPNSADRADQTRTFLFTTMTRNRNVGPALAMGTPTLVKTLLPDLAPLSTSPALDAGFVANPPDNGFLESVDFIGAVGPGNNWILSGWANFSDN